MRTGAGNCLPGVRLRNGICDSQPTTIGAAVQLQPAAIDVPAAASGAWPQSRCLTSPDDDIYGGSGAHQPPVWMNEGSNSMRGRYIYLRWRVGDRLGAPALRGLVG